jgi:hypothetical protein
MLAKAELKWAARQARIARQRIKEGLEGKPEGEADHLVVLIWDVRPTA